MRGAGALRRAQLQLRRQRPPPALLLAEMLLLSGSCVPVGQGERRGRLIGMLHAALVSGGRDLASNMMN